MNGPKGRLPSLKSVYRKRKIRLVLIILATVLALLIIGFLVIGNLLHQRSEEEDSAKNPREETSTAEQSLPPAPPSVSAYPVALESKDSSSFFSRLGALKEQGGTVASVVLNKKSGTRLYRSSLADELGLPTSGAGISLSDATEGAKAQGISLSGVFSLTAFSEDDALMRSVILAREASLVAEAMLAGFDDVLLLAPELSTEHLPEVVRFVDTVRALCPDACLGLTLSSELLSSEGASTLMDTLRSSLNFFALDATLSEQNDASATIEDTVSGNLYYVLRYEMRILIAEAENADTQSAWIASAEKSGISNWQILSGDFHS